MIKDFKLISKNTENKVTELLQEAIEVEFEECFIVGTKDKQLHIKSSGYDKLEEKLGALELLKHHLLDNSYINLDGS